MWVIICPLISKLLKYRGTLVKNFLFLWGSDEFSKVLGHYRDFVLSRDYFIKVQSLRAWSFKSLTVVGSPLWFFKVEGSLTHYWISNPSFLSLVQRVTMGDWEYILLIIPLPSFHVEIWWLWFLFKQFHEQDLGIVS